MPLKNKRLHSELGVAYASNRQNSALIQPQLSRSKVAWQRLASLTVAAILYLCGPYGGTSVALAQDKQPQPGLQFEVQTGAGTGAAKPGAAPAEQTPQVVPASQPQESQPATAPVPAPAQPEKADPSQKPDSKAPVSMGAKPNGQVPPQMESGMEALHDQALKDYQFTDAGVIDPFTPIKAVTSVTEKLEDNDPFAACPLCKISLSQIKLVAVAASENVETSNALVEDGAGVGYIVTVGTPIGMNKGKVVAIYNDHIVVEETIKDYQGKAKQTITELKLDHLEGDKK